MVKGAPSKYGRGAIRLGVLWLTMLAVPLAARAQQIEVPQFAVGYPTSEVSVAAGADGNMAFVWYEYGYGPSADDHGWARAFTASGSPLSDAVQIDLGGRFENPSIAALPGGGYIASSRYHNTNNNHHVLGRFLDALASPTGAPFQVDLDGLDLGGAAVTAIASGPVFLWHQSYPWVRRFGFAGQPLANPVHVDEDSSTSSITLDIVPLPNGGYVAAWFDFTRQVTRFRLYAANGLPTTPVGEIASFFFHRVAANAAGGVAIIGSYGGKLAVHRFDLDGQPVGDEIVLRESGGSAVADLEFDPSGNLYVVWSPRDFNVDLPIRVDVFGTDGFRLVPTTIISSSPAGYLRTARLTNGFFVNVWSYGFNSTAYANVVSICGVQQNCGNGVVDNACEQCDQGAANSDTQPDACRTTCKPASCGDGVTDSSEECDDANHADGDGCDRRCLVEICGNGRPEGAEACDDSNLIDGDGCDSNCRVTGCGNGVLTAGEECDDGNAVDGDLCDRNCLVEACGNSRVESGEECDDGNLIDGDGCDSNCDNTRCGNGIQTAGEECDDGNSTDGDGCDRLCLIEECGNARVEGNETCDDGNLVDGDGCQANCLLTPRVDPVLEPVRPVRIVLSSAGTATKTVRLAVRNADPEGLQILSLHAVGGTCPPGVIAAAPDFDARIAGTQDAAALLPGQRATARMSIRFSRGTFTAVDRNAPYRCALDLEVVPASGGAIDDTPANGHFSVDVEVFDRAAPSGSAEAYLQAVKPIAVRIPKGVLSRDRPLRVRATSMQPGTSFVFAVSDGDCPAGTVTLSSQDAAGSAVLGVRASRAFVTTPKHFSPQRCTATITATPSTDSDAGNNVVSLPIDILDENDVQ